MENHIENLHWKLKITIQFGFEPNFYEIENFHNINLIELLNKIKRKLEFYGYENVVGINIETLYPRSKK